MKGKRRPYGFCDCGNPFEEYGKVRDCGSYVCLPCSKMPSPQALNIGMAYTDMLTPKREEQL